MTTKSFKTAVFDKALLTIAAVLVAALIAGSFALGDKFHIPPAWIFGLGLSVIFVAAIGASLRVKFREPGFKVFFAGWLVVHVVVMLTAMSFLIFPLVIPLIFIELLIGYALAFRLFGVPPSDGG